MPSKAQQTPRRAARLPVASITLPFLGTRMADGFVFQYLIQDLSESGCRIALPSWLLKRERLHAGDKVNFHLPFRVGGRVLGGGAVAWARRDEESDAQVAGVPLEHLAAQYYPVSVNLDASSPYVDLSRAPQGEDTLERVVWDTIMLKRGVLIYLRHLEALISRLSDLSEEQADELRAFLFAEAEASVRANLAGIEDLHRRIRAGVCGEAQDCFDLEELRGLVESEIPSDVWKSAFASETLSAYLDAVKKLEWRMYANYNTAVMLYQHDLLEA